MKTRLQLLLIIICLCPLTNILAQEFSLPSPDKWYRLVTRYNGSDDRIDRCIELIPQNATENAGLLWAEKQLPQTGIDVNYQYFKFEPSPENDSLYAIICEADQGGYVDPTPTSYDRNGRWHYIFSDEITDESPDKYGFIFYTSETMSGVDPDGSSYCAITTPYAQDNGGWCMNAGGPEQDFAINLWYETYSEDANEWSFRLVQRRPIATDLTINKNDMQSGTDIIYDVFGRRVLHPTRGLYIVNGEKVIL